MFNVLIVGCGGFIGAALRYLVSIGVSGVYAHVFPLATLIVNIVGSFLIGVCSICLPHVFPENKEAMLFLTTGVLGGFTTFSTFSLETIQLFEDAQYGIAAGYMALSLAACIAGVFAGRLLARTLCS
ncbi:fluoride efflux transporter CrcB [Anaerotardibacter muris]|uniref:fluoride efflux transporter CrcB n=1 Tax=Anaerotardibacter muris TaxID=2941505 RepID=UPI002040F8D4|nr:fluoride efflux transporter CrcB [Anaerotardibacter muris]